MNIQQRIKWLKLCEKFCHDLGEEFTKNGSPQEADQWLDSACYYRGQWVPLLVWGDKWSERKTHTDWYPPEPEPTQPNIYLPVQSSE